MLQLEDIHVKVKECFILSPQNYIFFLSYEIPE